MERNAEIVVVIANSGELSIDTRVYWKFMLSTSNLPLRRTNAQQTMDLRK